MEIVTKLFNSTVLYLSTHFCLLSCMSVSMQRLASCWLKVCVCALTRENFYHLPKLYCGSYYSVSRGCANCCMLCFRVFCCWQEVIKISDAVQGGAWQVLSCFTLEMNTRSGASVASTEDNYWPDKRVCSTTTQLKFLMVNWHFQPKECPNRKNQPMW
jgi:hypothetical protein